jgi:hypothetical protein
MHRQIGFRKLVVAIVLLAIAAVSRLLLQTAVMPPYAGLDELFHVARLSFRLNEQREPDDREKSIPPYLASPIYESPTGVRPNRPTVLPSFALAGSNWPLMVRDGLTVRGDAPLDDAELQPYFEPNYEAQQPALYYATHARLAKLSVPRTAAGELRTWRRASAVFALITVIATAYVGFRTAGTIGLLATALLVSLPTWQTLVSRAGSDAMACAAIAVAIAITISAPKRWYGWLAEAASWAVAVSVKLYSWPLLPVVGLLWLRQRASRWRMACVALELAVAMLATMTELGSRTTNALGLFAFDPVTREGVVDRVPIDVAGIAEITIATGIWTSGQHGNALSVLGMALYAIPICALCVIGLGYRRRASPDRPVPYRFIAFALMLFAIAQMTNMSGYLRQAIAAGEALPAGGKEGWYWYALAPLLIGVGLAGALQGLAALSRTLAASLVLLIAGWDVAISEGALFRDYAGITGPSSPSMLFRWGAPMPVSFWDLERRLELVTIDPLVTWATELRVVHLVAIALLASLALGSLSPNREDENPQA